jgi:hypothetical protein
MEGLRAGIALTALACMAGSLGARNGRSTRNLTAYLVSNAMALPLSGGCARRCPRALPFLSVGAAIMFVLSFALRKNQPGRGRAVLE